jgi:hypothetical protein
MHIRNRDLQSNITININNGTKMQTERTQAATMRPPRSTTLLSSLEEEIAALLRMTIYRSSTE